MCFFFSKKVFFLEECVFSGSECFLSFVEECFFGFVEERVFFGFVEESVFFWF